LPVEWWLNPVIQVIFVYWTAIVGFGVWLYKSGSDLDRKINEKVEEK
jgi:hypothetical protein